MPRLHRPCEHPHPQGCLPKAAALASNGRLGFADGKRQRPFIRAASQYPACLRQDDRFFADDMQCLRPHATARPCATPRTQKRPGGGCRTLQKKRRARLEGREKTASPPGIGRRGVFGTCFLPPAETLAARRGSPPAPGHMQPLKRFRYASWETGRSRISWQLPQVNTPR